MLKLKKSDKVFEFQVEGSKKTYNLPSVSALPINDILAIQKLAKHIDENGQTDSDFETEALELFINIIRKNEPEVLDLLSYEQFSYLLEAYFDDMNMGE